jgi:hypothetical protein
LKPFGRQGDRLLRFFPPRCWHRHDNFTDEMLKPLFYWLLIFRFSGSFWWPRHFHIE